jgi:hypothetical protein
VSAVDAVDTRPRLDAMPRLLARRGRGQIGETWIARLDDGTLVAAKRIVAADEAALDLLLEAVARLAPLRHPSMVPVRGASVDGLSVWVVSELDDGLSLRRLLNVVRLSPEQAASVALSVISGLKALHEAGLWHGRLHADNVYISSTGRARLGDAGLCTAAGNPERQLARDLAAARALLHDILPIGADLPGSDANGLLAALSTRPEALAAGEREAVIAMELAALVARVGGGGTAAGRAQRAAVEPSTAATVPTRPAQPAAVRSRSFWPVAPAVAVAVVLPLLLVAGLIWWWVGGQAGVTARQHAPPVHASSVAEGAKPSQPAPTPKTTAPLGAKPAFVPVLAPRSGGEIENVDLGVVIGPCVPGSACKLSVQVNLAPRSADEEVDWVLVFFDRCSGQSTQEGGASILATPDWSFVYRRHWYTMPAGNSLAVIALTTAPVRTQSAPLLVGDAASC